jgi:hypothetical protein
MHGVSEVGITREIIALVIVGHLTAHKLLARLYLELLAAADV